MKNDFTANGFERWMNCRDAKKRAVALAESVGTNKYQGISGKIKLWLKVELACLRRTEEEKEKSSPKILW